MKREFTREKRDFKKEGTFTKRPRVDYDKDYGHMRDYVYNVLNNEDQGKELIKNIISGLNIIGLNRSSLEYKNERFAIRYFAKKWLEEYTATHTEAEVNNQLDNLFIWMIGYIGENTNLFTNDIVKSQTFEFVLLYVFPRLFILSEVQNDHRRKWNTLKNRVMTMMIDGSDFGFKRTDWTSLD